MLGQPSVDWQTIDRDPDSWRNGRRAAHRGTADAGEAVAKETAAQVALKLGANEAGKLAAGIALLRFEKKGGQVFAHNAVEQSLFGSRRW